MLATLQEVAATLTQKVARDLIAAASATPADKVNWQPMGNTRPIIHQLVECCLANAMWTNILQTHVHAVLPKNVAEQWYEELDTLGKVTVRLRETSTRLAEVIRGLSDDNLSATVALPWKPGSVKSVAECCFHPYWNMAYHEGQINYIQTLYGDHEEHSDSGPFGEY